MARAVLIISGIAVVIVGGLGFRGQTSTNRPWHVFLDMKYQPRYSAQGQSSFFADGRSSRLHVPGTVAYSGGTYRSDAGNLDEADPSFVPELDPAYYFARTKPDETTKEMVKVPKQRPKMGPDGMPLKDKDGKEVIENYEDEEERDVVVNFFVNRIPKKAIDEAIWSDGVVGNTGWDALMRRGRERYTIYCAVCHGDTGMGGQGESAHGILGRRGMNGIASYHVDRLREVPDGYLFDVITNGKNTMSSYGDQVKPQDRWSIVAYIRALQLSQSADEKYVPAAERQRLREGAKK